MNLLRRLWAAASAGPEYPPDTADLADVRIAGLVFPVRASIALFAMTAIIVVDQLGLLLPRPDTNHLSAFEPLLRPVVVARFALFLVVPLAIVTVIFRDSPARYGLRLGDWRWGGGLLLAGLVVMTPIILWLSSLESFRAFYGDANMPLGAALVNNLAEVVPADFLLLGFPMFTLWRRIGPLALVVVQVPFVLSHLGKPDIELWSTFIGGSVFAWLDWRTGSILWSALGHVYVLTLLLVAVGGAVP